MTDGSNLINESMVRALMRKEAILERAKKQASDALNIQHKKIKTYGLKVKNFLAIYHQMTASDDGDEYIQDLREQRRLAQMMKLPIGHQMDLIDAFDAMGKVSEEIGFRAYRDGARAHLDGKEEGDIPHASNSEEGQEWLRGYRWSVEACGDGERELAAVEADMPAPDEAAEGTIPAAPTEKKKRGRRKASADDAAAPVQ